MYVFIKFYVRYEICVQKNNLLQFSMQDLTFVKFVTVGCIALYVSIKKQETVF